MSGTKCFHNEHSMMVSSGLKKILHLKFIILWQKSIKALNLQDRHLNTSLAACAVISTRCDESVSLRLDRYACERARVCIYICVCVSARARVYICVLLQKSNVSNVIK